MRENAGPDTAGGLPTLTLTLARGEAGVLTVAATQGHGTAPAVRTVEVPWAADPAFRAALVRFWADGRTLLADKDAQAAMAHAAYTVGTGLAGMLAAEERALLIGRFYGDPPQPFLVIESDDDLLLALPWELLHLDGRFAVRDGYLDVAHCVPCPGQAARLAPPDRPLDVLICVAAPEDQDKLDYETEAWLVTRAVHPHLGAVVAELGEVEDLLTGLGRTPAPRAVHFSGHGLPGGLAFEDADGDTKLVPIGDLVTRIRQGAPAALPRLFVLASCHGGDAPAPDPDNGTARGATSTAAELHRQGIPQVVAYVGSVLDRLATLAGGALYRALADGKRTREAVRRARLEMAQPVAFAQRELLRNPQAGFSAGTLAFGWAQLLLFHRGPDHPLGTPVGLRPVIGTTQRRLQPAFPGARKAKLLREGLIGRRRELHRLRRDLRAGRTRHIVQGLGGLGKSTFCAAVLDLYESDGWQPLALWCAEAEDAPDSVAALLLQLEARAKELVGEPTLLALIQAIDEVAARDPAFAAPAARLAAIVGLLAANLPQPLVLYLDNLESLLEPPADRTASQAAGWRGDAGELWHRLVTLAREQPDRLALLASCRYDHGGFGGMRVPFARLPDEALYRLLGWYPSLRRLGWSSAQRLVPRLGGHPRAADFLDGLIGDAIARFEDEAGQALEAAAAGGGADWPEREWRDLVAPALAGLDEKLEADLLFARLWDRVLDLAEQRLLLRARVLRRPAARELVAELADDPQAGLAQARRLAGLSLLEETEPVAGGPRRLAVHPLVGDLARARAEGGAVEAAEQEGHLRAGAWYERAYGPSSPFEDDFDAVHHLDAAGECDRALLILGPWVESIQSRSGRHLDALLLLGAINAQALSPQGMARWLSIRGSSYVGLGDLTQAGDAFEQSVESLNDLAAADPANADWQRDLSISWSRVGDVRQDQGDLRGALQAYTAQKDIADKLAAADPSNTQWQRDLSVSWNRLGDVRRVQGDLQGALQAYTDCKIIRDKLAAADPGNAEWQRDLFVSWNKLGDVRQAQGDLPGALQAFTESKNFADHLAAADPGNASWQRDLSVSWNFIGNIQMAQGGLDEALSAYTKYNEAIANLAATDPGNTEWQRDLSVSWNKLGDVRQAQGDLPGALQAYTASKNTRDRLAAADPGNALWQRDLSVSWNKLGDVRVAQGDLPGALQAFTVSKNIADHLAAADPGNAEWQRDLIVSYVKLAETAASGPRPSSAAGHYREALRVARDLAASGRLAPVDAWIVDNLEQRLAAAEAS